MDWSKVEELALLGYYGRDKGPFFNSTPSALMGLRRLELEGECRGTTLRFLQNLQNDTLTHLVWRGYFNSTLPFIVQQFQGSSLEHLDIHTSETVHVESPSFSASELEPLQHLPNLTHLSLNVARNGTWPLEMLSAISQIPSLRTADLWLDIASTCWKQKEDSWYPESEDTGCMGEDQYLLPFINETTTLEVFKHMRANKVGNPCCLFFHLTSSRPSLTQGRDSEMNASSLSSSTPICSESDVTSRKQALWPGTPTLQDVIPCDTESRK
ncbi:uncharacterized protein A1O9_12065 [Exophiala aquamarina CBS 119918]|uniref:Uncharacterized protein n=1 Tax=Exophiala aquamarina CBS 119918 TaxID=1182545 RepID=A0A072NXH6_9EURO|nr:uncharacterized protein A1O9_12065 [Exophiala aquamarina CBS 119918]KEF51728.1 hypothetical protein A1O9_12065 [Exophiala aquamarina CBS 119918]